jgi:subtilisin family serine protease
MAEKTRSLSPRASISLQLMQAAAPDDGSALGMVRPLARRNFGRETRPADPEVAVIVEVVEGKDIRKLLQKAKATKTEYLGGNFYAAIVPLRKANLLYETADVRYVEALKQKRPLLEKALVDGTVGLPDKRMVEGEGGGVVVGIIDSGFDLSHPAFRDSAGRLRVDALLEQSYNARTEKYSTRTYTTARLEAGWKKHGARPGFDKDGHGTHVASIAAGSRFNGASGVAPKARYVLVKTDFMRLAEATKWCFDKAGARPAVVNMSLGGHYGAHDGASREERVLEHLSGPGRIVVLAAGNEREDNIHVGARFAVGHTETASIDISTEENAETIVCWFDRQDKFDVSLIAPSGLKMDTPSGSAVKEFSANGARVSLARKAHPQRAVTEVLVDVAFRSGADPSDFKGWKLQVTCTKAGVGRFDAWITGNSAFHNGRFVETARTIGLPATANGVIAVACHVTKDRWQSDDGAQKAPGAVVGRSSRFSSRGPTRDGREKPEISAPGEMITAALARGSLEADDGERAHTPSRTLTIEGTSMATPFVTGVIALMLERQPKLGPAELLDAIKATAVRDAQTGPANWTPDYGHGKISARALVKHMNKRPPSGVASVGKAKAVGKPAVGKPKKRR